MFDANAQVKIYVATEPQDMRKSFLGLAKAVSVVIGKDPRCGHLFAFLNRRRNLMKVLSWDENGFCLLCKRLSGGVFLVPAGDSGKNHVEVTAAALTQLVKARHIAVENTGLTYNDGKFTTEKAARGPQAQVRSGVASRSHV